MYKAGFVLGENLEVVKVVATARIELFTENDAFVTRFMALSNTLK